MTARNAAAPLRHADRPSLEPGARPDVGSESADGQDVMTQAQEAALRRLSEQAFEPEAFSRHLTRIEAQRRIDALAAKLRLQDGPPHTL